MAKILIVDDEVEILEVVSLLLTMHGFTVQKLSDAGKAVSEINTFNPDVVLLDVNLSGYDGRKICKQLKSADSAYKDIPIILFSAMHDLHLTYPECEATDFISKPFDNNKLVEKIKKYTKAA